MSVTTCDLSTLRREVWIQIEGCAKMRLFIESHVKIIEDLKEQLFGDSRDQYQPVHLQQNLNGGVDIPSDASGENPIQFKRISNRRSLPSNKKDTDAGMEFQMKTHDPKRTRTMIDNFRQVAKCNKCMNKSRTNDDPDGADGIGCSRDCLLSANTSSDGWTFNGLLREAANYLWRGMSNGNNTSYKSKSE